VTAFGLLILQIFYIKQEELIGQKLILVLQGIKLLFNKNSSIIISLRYFSLSYVAKG
jgi:hypothetical protein